MNMNWLLVVSLGSSLAMMSCAGARLGASGDKADMEKKKGCKVRASVDLENLKSRIERYEQVSIEFERQRFDERGLKALKYLIEASRVMDELFWKQASAKGLEFRRCLTDPENETERLLAHYLKINYGPYDRLDNMEPFIETRPRPKGATFYPADMTKEEFESWIDEHPGDKGSFQSWFTVIRRDDSGGLKAIPYSRYYRKDLQRAADYLKKAANNIDNRSFAKFLKSRAEAFMSNQYTQSDMDWMDVKGSDLEATIGPYEVYEDHLLNYKAAFESFITLRDPVQSEKLSKMADHLTDMEKNLPIPDEHKNFERGQLSPIVVADLVFSAGDTRAGVQTLAFNLPNDEEVREKKGSKKVMLKNVSRAKFTRILTPIASRVLVGEQLDDVTFDAYFNHTLMHEISHGLGPGRILHEGERVPVNLVLGELYSTTEEAKADVLGIYNSLYMVSKGELPAGMRDSTLITFLAGVFRSVRFGVHEAHGRANLVAFNYLVEGGAYVFDTEKKRYSVDLEKAPGVIDDLAREILMLQALGDYPKTAEFIERYGQMGEDMRAVIETLTDIPVDIEPIFEVEKVFPPSGS